MKRKSIILALAGLLALVVALPSGSTVNAGGEPENAIYLALGDSMAEGWGNNVLERYPYVPRFYDYLHDGHHSDVGVLNNQGHGGETSGSLITGVNPPYPPEPPRVPSQLQAALAIIADPNTDVSVVTIDIGGNDFLDLMRPGGPCQDPNDPDCMPAVGQAIGVLAQNYAYILGSISAAVAADPGEERFITMTYFNPFSGTPYPYNLYETPVEDALTGMDHTFSCAGYGDLGWEQYIGILYGVNDVLSCTPGMLGLGSVITVADLYPRFQDKGGDLTWVYNNYNIHPNNAGYTQIANALRYAYLNP